MKLKKTVLLTCCLIVLGIISACGPVNASPPTTEKPVPTTPTTEQIPLLTITYHNGTCEYDGPESVDNFKAKLKIINDDENLSSSNDLTVSVVYLEEGKTIEDLRAWKEHSHPQWASIIGTKSLEEDVTEGEYDIYLPEETFYFICFFEGAQLGVQGPVYWGKKPIE